MNRFLAYLSEIRDCFFPKRCPWCHVYDVNCVGLCKKESDNG